MIFSKMNSVEIIDKKNNLRKSMQGIIDACRLEVREMTLEEREAFDNAKEEVRKLNQDMIDLKNKLESYSIDEEETRTITNKNNTITNNTKMEFRLLSAINKIANNKTLDEFEQQYISVGANEMRNAGVTYGGQIQLPTESRSDYSVTATSGATVATEVPFVLEPLRGKNVLSEMGCRIITGLKSNVKVPVMSAINAAWAGEVASASDGGAAISEVELSPVRLTTYVDVSKEFIALDTADAESLIRKDIVNSIQTKLEQTILGTGYTGVDGIFATPATANTTAFSGLTALEAEVEDENVNGKLGYVMSNKAKAVFRNMAKSSLTNELVLQGGEIDGTPVYATSNVPNKNFAVGDFSNVIIGQWGGIDLTVDPFSQATNGKIRLVVNAYFACKIARPNAIKVGKVA